MDILHFLNYWILGIFDFFVILTLKLVNIFGFLNFWLFRRPALGAGEHGEIFEFLNFSSSCPWSLWICLNFWIFEFLNFSLSCPWSWRTWWDFWIFDFFVILPLELVNKFGFLNFWIFRCLALGAGEYVWIFEFFAFSSSWGGGAGQ